MGRGWIHGHRLVAGAKKGKLFTKIAKEIAVAVKTGGTKDPDSNARLRMALEDARKNSVPKDTITRALKRGAGETQEGELLEMLYEGYAAHGVAVLVEALTDNKNRTVQDLRALFTRAGGSLGEPGSVQWMFQQVSSVLAKAPEEAKDFDAEEVAIHAGAEDVQDLEGGLWQFTGQRDDLAAIQKGLEEQSWLIDKAEFAYIAKTPAEITEEQEESIRILVEKLDDHDDVKRVHLSL